MDLIIDTEKVKRLLTEDDAFNEKQADRLLDAFRSASSSALDKRLKAMENRIVLKTCGILIPSTGLMLALLEYVAS